MSDITKDQLIAALNEDLALEFTAVLQYLTYAAKVSGPSRPELKAFFEAEIPGGLYRGNPDAVASFGPGATLVTRADVPDEVISVLVTAIFSKLDRLRGLDPVLADLEPEAMTKDGLTAPLHPAAAAYFSTQGLTN